MSALTQRLIERIVQDGPISVADFMAACLYDPDFGYYTTRPGVASARDFLTAPESSQMFGELIGLWGADCWGKMGAPAPFQWVELGPGSGALSADAFRAMKAMPGMQGAAQVSLIEVSPALRKLQSEALGAVGARPAFCARIEEAPPGPSILIANEFFDCLPIRQFQCGADGHWRELLVGVENDALRFGLAREPAPLDLQGAPGAWHETAPGLSDLVGAIATRLNAAPGFALIVDYGFTTPRFRNTLQALKAHRPVDPLAAPGEADLTAHVDFDALGRSAHAAGLSVHGPIGQGAFLEALGIAVRAARLAALHPARKDGIAAQVHRLTHADEMGVLFQILCLSSRDLPPPAGFTPTLPGTL